MWGSRRWPRGRWRPRPISNGSTSAASSPISPGCSSGSASGSRRRSCPSGPAHRSSIPIRARTRPLPHRCGRTADLHLCRRGPGARGRRRPGARTVIPAWPFRRHRSHRGRGIPRAPARSTRSLVLCRAVAHRDLLDQGSGPAISKNGGVTPGSPCILPSLEPKLDVDGPEVLGLLAEIGLGQGVFEKPLRRKAQPDRRLVAFQRDRR